MSALIASLRWIVVALVILVAAHASGQTTWPPRPESRSVIQGGDWTISHIGSTLHVIGTVQVNSGIQIGNIAHISSALHVVGQVRGHYSGALRATQVQSCGTTAAQVVGTNTDRRDLYVKNIGLPNNPPTAHTVFLGFGATGHVALTVNNGWAIHAAGLQFPTNLATGVISPVVYTDTQLILQNYQGPLSCISTGSGSNLSVIEVLR